MDGLPNVSMGGVERLIDLLLFHTRIIYSVELPAKVYVMTRYPGSELQARTAPDL
jgi:hypothetical protein